MNASDLSNPCQPWHIGDSTLHPPVDQLFLSAVANAGFIAFTGPSGLCGGKSKSRTVLAIHRGRGKRWELVFREYDCDVITTSTADLASMTPTLVGWLAGNALLVAEDAVRAVAG